MKFSIFSTVALAWSASAATIGRRDAVPDAEPSSVEYTIELAPGQVKTVTEAEKWALKKVCTTSAGRETMTDQFLLSSSYSN